MTAKKGKFRTIIKIQGKNHYAIRNPNGTFANIEKIGLALTDDRRIKAKTKVKPQHGFRGDLKRV